jgi:hypothetical protein
VCVFSSLEKRPFVMQERNTGIQICLAEATLIGACTGIVGTSSLCSDLKDELNYSIPSLSPYVFQIQETLRTSDSGLRLGCCKKNVLGEKDPRCGQAAGWHSFRAKNNV